MVMDIKTNVNIKTVLYKYRRVITKNKNPLRQQSHRYLLVFRELQE